MRFLSKKLKASSAAARWREKFPEPVQHYTGYGPYKGTRLEELGPDPSPESVNEILGCTHWTDVFCDHCGDSVESIVILESSCYECNGEYTLCSGCITQATKLLETMKDV